MDEYKGKTLSWRVADGVVELALDRAPANEIGLAMLEDLERLCLLASRSGIEGQRADYLQRAESGLLRRRGPARTVSSRRKRWTRRPPRKEFANSSNEFMPCSTGLNFSAHDDRGRSWRVFRRRIRAGAGVRSDRRGQDGALLLSGIAAGADSRIRRHSAAEARYRQRRGARSCCSPGAASMPPRRSRWAS